MESSGNESSRKRAKKAATGSVRDSRASTPVSQRPKKIPGASSDGEATATEMSDSGRPKALKKKSKLVVGSHGKGTPTGSRAGSPVPGSSQLPPGSQTPSRATSPSAPNSSPPLTAEDIIACLNAHPEGMNISQMAQYFKGPRMSDRKLFITLVKNNAKWGPDKLLRPKGA
ncbi:hypothetical protein M406DRAFT_288549 [Cryphonectria parasitica EP155]|uniref:Uncharacterized protein n=1 Tax=Cryphonectria parasitica (strain ATCC 38755 / EP155) TaxID=660469 RepID=A0A9P4Y6X0_CRYP1|nr:uncharacterized protein M406DRAFT_288549 [Cryphonectria parasitica EP155]KAF3767472.1 hypothetical protein M406DRAFT_288549 [Cryphonectria parasitica EP155]